MNVLRPTFIALTILLFTATSVFGQIGDLDLRKPLGIQKGGAAKPTEKVEARLVADVKAIQAGKPFKLGFLFEVPKGYYAYYKTPGSIGLPTKITLSGPEGFTVGPLQWPGPDVKHGNIGGSDVANYIYKRNTVVFAEVTPPADLKPETELKFTATGRFQYCKEDGSCFLEQPKLELALPAAWPNTQAEPSAEASLFQAAERSLPVAGGDGKFAKASAQLTLDKIYPNAEAQLQVIVDVADGYHIQMHQPPNEALISTDVILELPSGVNLAGSIVYPEPSEPLKTIPGFEGVKEYRGRVAVAAPIKAKESLDAESVVFTGLVRYQACNDEGTCYPPVYASFSTEVPVAKDASEASPLVASVTAPGSGAGGGGTGVLDNLRPVDSEFGKSMGTYLFYAFLGGLILNVMPCVLPVVAIKILSFVQQAGESRARVLALNIAYSVGILTVFMILATLAVVVGIGWGGLFQRDEFNLFMAGLVFAMGLSLLGVFEIPVPGFVGSAAGGAHREGLFGAYLTGIFATLLATPCSGPFLGVTLGWSVQQEVSITYATWALMGLGMATPYLILGLFPGAIRFLPKPGNWMVRFKELAGLVLMGTVVFIISYLKDTYTLPALVMLTGIAIGAYMIGNLYDINSRIQHKAMVRASALLITGGVCVLGFTIIKDVAEYRKERDLEKYRQKFVEDLDKQLKDQLDRPLAVMLAEKQAGQKGAENSAELPWEPFSEKRLAELLTAKKSVLIDFTADWCWNCKVNEFVALNTPETKQLVEELGVVPLYADMTEHSPEMQAVLEKFGSISVPLTVIFPADRPNEPIVLRDVFTKARLLEALRDAGKPAEKVSQAPVPSTR